jgi:hypothetical protein
VSAEPASATIVCGFVGLAFDWSIRIDTRSSKEECVSDLYIRWQDSNVTPIGRNLGVAMTRGSSTGSPALALGRVSLLCALISAFPLLSQAPPDCTTKSGSLAAFSASCSGGGLPVTCTFTLTAPTSSVQTVAWNFGDGSAIQDQVLAAGAAFPWPSTQHPYGGVGYFLVTATVTMADGQIAAATGGIWVGGAQAALASDDSFETDTNTPITIGFQELLSNDAPGVNFDHIDSTCPAPRCALNNDGQSLTYTPPNNFPAPSVIGNDSFIYWVRDSAGNTGWANVVVTVTRPLVAGPDFFTANKNTPIEIATTKPSTTAAGAPLLANDSAGAIFVSAENPLNGSLSCKGGNSALCSCSSSVPVLCSCTAASASVVPSCSYIFSPAPNFSGTASFDYRISWDGNPPYETGFVTVKVLDPLIAAFSVACGPNAVPAQASYRTCLVHSTSGGGVGGIARWQWNWGDGSPTVEPPDPFRWADQSYTYGGSGRYTITHTVIDTVGTSASAQASVIVDTPPVAADDSAATTRDVPVTKEILANDSDADRDQLSFIYLSGLPAGATWKSVQLANRPAIQVTPPDSFVGTLRFSYAAFDGWVQSPPATVTIAVNQSPAPFLDALGEQYYVAANGFVPLPAASLLSNDYSSSGASLAIVAYDTSLLRGTLVDGNIACTKKCKPCAPSSAVCTFMALDGYTGVTSFLYTVADSVGNTASAVVRFYVGTKGSPPSAGDAYFSTLRNVPAQFAIQDLWRGDTDPDGDTLAVSGLTGSSKRDFGSLACTSPIYRCTYSPNPGFVGIDHFPYAVSDGINPASAAFVNILTLPPSTPTFDAREDVVATTVNQPTYISNRFLTGNDYDPAGFPISVASVDTSGLIGSLTCDAFGCQYQPNPTFQGTTSFKYTATNGHGASDTAIVKIKVGGINTPPVVPAPTLATPVNTPLKFSIFDLLGHAYDPDNDPLNVAVNTVTATLGSLTCSSPAYWCSYTPNANVSGTESISFSVSDGTAIVSSTLTISIGH